MTAIIEKDFNFHTAVHFNNTFYINLYEVTLTIEVDTDSTNEQNVAMDRATYFLSEVLQDSILISSTESEQIAKYKAAGLRPCELPEEPYDQIVAMAILCKINAIMEEKLRVNTIRLSSTLGDSVKFTVSSETADHVLPGNYWWNKPSICLSKCDNHVDGDENVVKLFDDTTWAELGLSWKNTN